MNTNYPTQRVTTRPRRRIWLQLFLWAVIFGSGLAVGVGVTLMGIVHAVRFPIQHPREMPAKIAERLQRVLELDEQQVERVEQILQERQQALEKIRFEFQPAFEAELDVIDEQISAELDEQQRDKWRQRFGQLRRTWIPPLPSNSDNQR